MSTASRDRPDALSVPEILRIMDVATAIRQDREVVEEQLNLDELKARLRERMLAAARVTGEDVTPEEVDAAISHYYSSLHAFHEPPRSFPLFLAHVWVRRYEILQWGGLALGVTLLTWWMFLSPTGPLTLTGRTRKKVEALSAEVVRHRDAIRSLTKAEEPSEELARLTEEAETYRKQKDVEQLQTVNASLAELEGRVRQMATLSAEVSRLRETVGAVARDPGVSAEVERLAAEAEAYRKHDDPVRLDGVRAELADLESRVRSEYTVSVVSPHGGRSAVRRAYPDKDGKRLPRFYLIVEARKPDGTTVRRRVHNGETGGDEEVTTWAERVPEEVYNRLAKDKKEDGILNETRFAVKRRGFAEEEVTMPGSDGRPLTRTGQITAW